MTTVDLFNHPKCKSFSEKKEKIHCLSLVSWSRMLFILDFNIVAKARENIFLADIALAGYSCYVIVHFQSVIYRFFTFILESNIDSPFTRDITLFFG